MEWKMLGHMMREQNQTRRVVGSVFVLALLRGMLYGPGVLFPSPPEDGALGTLAVGRATPPCLALGKTLGISDLRSWNLSRGRGEWHWNSGAWNNRSSRVETQMAKRGVCEGDSDGTRKWNSLSLFIVVCDGDPEVRKWEYAPEKTCAGMCLHSC